VEDSPAGVQAALAAGMTVFGYAGTTPGSRLDGARVFTDMAELPGLLQPS
jgi:beta-phosphoglucomutase-like phosphatase (HAD superfamily)